jgi:hypothetical protein
VIFVALFVWLVWPTPYSYRNYKPDDISMLAPDRKTIVEIQVDNERQAREIGFELVLVKPTK